MKTLKTKVNEEEVNEAAENEEQSLVSDGTTTRLDTLLELVVPLFNLRDSYVVSGFKDVGKRMTVTLDNRDFSVTVTVKDVHSHPLLQTLDLPEVD